MRELAIEFYNHPDPIFNDHGIWDTLLQHSAHNTIFMTSAWLKAAWMQLDKTAVVWIAVIVQQQNVVAAGAFVNQGGTVTLLGTGYADYQDILLHATLSEETALYCVSQLLTAVQAKIPTFKGFYFTHCLDCFKTPTRLAALAPRYYTVPINSDLAPLMTMDRAPLALKKKSLLRHEHQLQQLGQLRCQTWTEEGAILARLESLFDLHVRRWQHTGFPSLFKSTRSCDFYRDLTRALAPQGWLRYTEVSIDKVVIACHFGFFYQGVFTWYKPAFEPALAQYSPGEVLIKRLIEDAVALNARDFDFTLGAEAFKFRFANITRTVMDTYVTDSFLRYLFYAGKSRVQLWLNAPPLAPLRRCYKYLRSKV